MQLWKSRYHWVDHVYLSFPQMSSGCSVLTLMLCNAMHVLHVDIPSIHCCSAEHFARASDTGTHQNVRALRAAVLEHEQVMMPAFKGSLSSFLSHRYSLGVLVVACTVYLA